MKKRFISGSVIVIGPPRLICRSNSGTTDPRLPSTLPNLTAAKARLERKAASRTITSASRLDAPMTLVGDTALSVEISTSRSVP